MDRHITYFMGTVLRDAGCVVTMHIPASRDGAWVLGRSSAVVEDTFPRVGKTVAHCHSMVLERDIYVL